MWTHDIAPTYKAAFTAFEQSECRRLQAELEQWKDAAAAMQLENTKLQNDIVYLNDTCRLLCTRFI